MKQNIFYLGLVILMTLGIAHSVLAASSSGNMTGQERADVFQGLKFRNLGPTVAGGRVNSIVGVPGNPYVYYVGSAGGGVFKTADGGVSWKNVFKNQATGSIGTLAIDPSNHNVIWVGTGDPNVRNTAIDGAGIYRSTDAGRTWKRMGLKNAGQISSIAVNPNNSNVVYVGVLGHIWGPNKTRGVYRTTDGGKTWKKILYIDKNTGVSDLVMAPGNPQVLFAGMWYFRRYPWTLIDGGKSSGIYRSTDGGNSWKRLSKGLPTGKLGRIGLAIAPSNPKHIYAVIGAKHGMLWVSHDMGDSWTMINGSHNLDVRPFYFSKMAVAPDNENRVYFLSKKLMESTDGGKTAHWLDRGVHVDHHAIWIDPKNPKRIIQGNDGGVFLSNDGGKHWEFLNNIPIEQFYMTAADNQSPYHLCGGLQDNGSWCGPSSNLGRRGVTGQDWKMVGPNDGQYAVPTQSNHNLVYVDFQQGYIQRNNLETHISKFIRPTLSSVREKPPNKLKYRFNWTTPIAVSAKHPNTVYLGGNVVFRSTDGGKHWQPISKDLTRNDKSKQKVAGGPIMHDITGAENYDTILSVNVAPTNSKVIWVGTDDGLVHVTRNGGKTWHNVTDAIPGAPKWGRVFKIGVSPFDAGTAYVTFDAHMLDNRHPYVYRTHNYGKSWTRITDGLPDNSPAHVVRESPNKRGFLVLGTDTALYYSSDDGGHWQPLKPQEFPTTPVYDIRFIKDQHDLVVATFGHGLYVLDDIRPLEEFSDNVKNAAFHLFKAGPGTLYNRWSSGESSALGYQAPNAPTGVLVDYYLKSKLKANKREKRQHHTPVKIQIRDMKGNLVATDYGPAKKGVNRFEWNMHYQGATKLDFVEQPDYGEESQGNRGPRVIASNYKIAVTVDGKTQTRVVAVKPDPNVDVNPKMLRAQTKAALKVRNEVSALNEMLNRIHAMRQTLSDFERATEQEKDNHRQYAGVLKRARALGKRLSNFKDEIFNPKVQRSVAQERIHYLADFHGKLAGLAGGLSYLYDQASKELFNRHMVKLNKQLHGYLQEFNQMLKTSVASYNKAAYNHGLPTLRTGEPVKVKVPPNI